MNYWIITLPREDLEHCLKIGTYGHNRNKLKRVQPGDQLAFCATKEWKIIAFGKVASPVYTAENPVFRDGGIHPHRFDFIAMQTDEIDFRAMIPAMSFITVPNCWPVYFKGSVKSIPEQDWKLIQKARVR